MVLLALGLFTCQPNSDDGIVLRIGITHPADHSFSKALRLFSDSLYAQSGGQLKVELFLNAQVGDEMTMQEMLTIGSLDMSVTGLLNVYDPVFSVFELPYLYRDRDHVLAVNYGPIMEEAAAGLPAKGLRLIGFLENGYRNVTNSVRPINSPQELVGLRIRTPENNAQIETMRSLGAIPTPIPFADLYTALVQGVVDGQENPLQNIWHFRMYEVQDHVAMTGHIYNSAYLVMSQKSWEPLSAEHQELIMNCMRMASDWQLQYMAKLDVELTDRKSVV